MSKKNESNIKVEDNVELRKFRSNPCWIAFMHPYVFIVPDDEKPWEVKLEDINNVSYNHGNLVRIVTKFKTGLKDLDGLICYDGAIALPINGSFLQKEDAINYFNRLFLKLSLSGFYVEYVDHRDVVRGQLHDKWAITNTEFGESAPSQLHSKNRSRVSSNFDTIMLSSPRILKVGDLHRILLRGEEVLAKIPNLSPKFLNIGITEIRYKNWDLVLSNLWISAEQLIDHLWHNRFLKAKSKHPNKDIPGRKLSLKDDSRTWSAGVKQEMLFQMGYLSEETFNQLFMARKIRNKLVHEGKGADEDTALGMFNAVKALLKLVVEPDEISLEDFKYHRKHENLAIQNIDEDLFKEWRELPDLNIVETVFGTDVTKNAKQKG